MAGGSRWPLWDLARWLGQGRVLAFLALALFCLGSALAVVTVSHQSRQAFMQMRVLEEERDQLQGEFEKLLLEQGAWSSYARVQQLAEKELGLHEPDPAEFVIVSRGDLQ